MAIALSGLKFYVVARAEFIRSVVFAEAGVIAEGK